MDPRSTSRSKVIDFTVNNTFGVRWGTSPPLVFCMASPLGVFGKLCNAVQTWVPLCETSYIFTIVFFNTPTCERPFWATILTTSGSVKSSISGNTVSRHWLFYWLRRRYGDIWNGSVKSFISGYSDSMSSTLYYIITTDFDVSLAIFGIVSASIRENRTICPLRVTISITSGSVRHSFPVISNLSHPLCYWLRRWFGDIWNGFVSLHGK